MTSSILDLQLCFKIIQKYKIWKIFLIKIANVQFQHYGTESNEILLTFTELNMIYYSFSDVAVGCQQRKQNKIFNKHKTYPNVLRNYFAQLMLRLFTLFQHTTIQYSEDISAFFNFIFIFKSRKSLNVFTFIHSVFQMTQFSYFTCY